MAIVVELAPLNPATGTRVTLRLAASDDRRLTALNDLRWWPGIVTPPTLTMEGWDGDFSGSVVIASATLGVDPVALKKNDPQSPAYRWAGAPMRVYEGNPDAPWSAWTLRFAGLIEDYSTDDSGRYTFTATVDGEPFDAALLSASYLGTGGGEGGDDLKAKAKPMLFGRAQNVEPILVDSVNNVYQVHGYGPIQAVAHVYERAADLVTNGGVNVGNFATFDALVAATIAEGSFGTCLANGMFRLGAPPSGLITADVDGDNSGGFVRTTAAVISRLCAIADVDATRIDGTSMAALATAVPYPINLYITTPTTLIDMVQQLARPCNAQALISWTGQLRVVRFGSIPFARTVLDAQGRARPAVLGNQEVKTSPPYRRIEMLGARSWRKHSKDEVIFDDPYELIAIIASDAWLSRGEKPQVVIDHQALIDERDVLQDRYVALGSPSEVAAARVAAVTAVDALNTYLASLTPAWNDPTSDTPIVPADYRAKWGDAYQTVSAFGAAITGRPGANGLTVVLSNESQTLAADVSGNVTSYSGASGTVQVFSGTADVTGLFTLGTASGGNPQSLTVAYSGAAYSVSGGFDASEPIASLTIRASGSGGFAGVTIDKVFSLAKSYAGTDGSPAVLITITASPAVLKYDKSNAYVGGAVTFATVRQNSTAVPQFRIRTLAGIAGYTNTAAGYASAFPGVWTTTGADNLTVAASEVPTQVGSGGGGFIMEAFVGTVTDRVTLVKVADGADGANGHDGTDGYPAIGFVRDSNPGPGQFVNQTWYRPSYKEWYFWTGSAWQRILGDVTALDDITRGASLNGPIKYIAAVAYGSAYDSAGSISYAISGTTSTMIVSMFGTAESDSDYFSFALLGQLFVNGMAYGAEFVVRPSGISIGTTSFSRTIRVTGMSGAVTFDFKMRLNQQNSNNSAAMTILLGAVLEEFRI